MNNRHYGSIPYGPKSISIPWLGTDNETRWNQICLQSERLGWRADSIQYSLNDQGWRTPTPSTARGSGIMFLGCSYTVGIGVTLEQSWSYQVWKESGTECFWNLAVGGSGLDTASRLFWYWAPLLKPKEVYILPPPEPRREFVTDKGFHCISLHNEDSHDQESMRRYFHWDSEQHIHRERCKSWIEYTAQQLSIKIHWATVLKYDLLGRDLIHPGIQWHKNLAEQFLSNSL
jgi:hypothetical protein